MADNFLLEILSIFYMKLKYEKPFVLIRLREMLLLKTLTVKVHTIDSFTKYFLNSFIIAFFFIPNCNLLIGIGEPRMQK